MAKRKTARQRGAEDDTEILRYVSLTGDTSVLTRREQILVGIMRERVETVLMGGGVIAAAFDKSGLLAPPGVWTLDPLSGWYVRVGTHLHGGRA